MILHIKKEPGRQARASVRIYGEETIDAMNQIVEATGKRPSQLVQDWVAVTHAELVDEGKIEPS